MSGSCGGFSMADPTSRPWLKCTGSTSFSERTLYATCTSSCAKCSEYNGRLGMADSVANLWDLLPLWDQLHAPVAGLTSFEPDLAVRCRDGASVFAHRFVLALRSDFFEAKIRLRGVLGNEPSTSSGLLEVNLCDLQFSKREVVEAVVHFAYKSAPPAGFKHGNCGFVCDVLKLANYLMMDHLVVADCNALMGGTGDVRSGLLGRNPSFIMTYLKVGEEISNQSVMDTALLYLRHLPDIPEDFVALAPFAVIKSFLRHPEKFNFRSFRSNCGLGAVERERALLLIAVKFVKFDMENRLPVMTQLLGELRLAYFADEVEAMIQDNLGLSDYIQDDLSWTTWDLRLLVRRAQEIAQMSNCNAAQTYFTRKVTTSWDTLGHTVATTSKMSKSEYEPRPNSVKHFLWSTTIFGGYSPRGWKARLKIVGKRKRESEGESNDVCGPKKKKKKKLSNVQAQEAGGDNDSDVNNNEDKDEEDMSNITVKSLAGGEYPVDVQDFQFAGETQDRRISRIAFHETTYQGDRVVCGIAVRWSDGKEESIGDMKGNGLSGMVNEFSLLPHEGCFVRVDEAKNFNQTTDFVGPVFLGTSGYNEQYNSRLGVRPMPGIGAERLPPVSFNPDFDSLQQHVSAKSNHEEFVARGFTSSYKALGRLESNHFFLDGVRGKAVTFEPPKGLGKEERRITLICRLKFKLSVLLNSPLWPAWARDREFNVNMIKDEIELPNGVEFMRLLKSAKMKVRHPDDIQAVSLCPSAERDVYPMLHRVYPRKSTAAAPPKEGGS